MDATQNAIAPAAHASAGPLRIDVCIATYRRPQLLDKLLHSLHAQELPPDTEVRWIVVDNDPEQSGQATVQAALDRGWPVQYHSQPRKNISLTRNVALGAARAPWIAFLDDDEEASPRWLAHLLEAAQRYQADVVFGPVQGVLPAEAPSWAESCGAFRREPRPTGTAVPFGGAGNVLIRAACLPEPGLRFDLRFGLTGGEDTDLFSRMQRAGARLIWCDEALATEPVAPERLTVNWVLRREFRTGQSYADILGRPAGVLARVPWVAYRLGLLGIGAGLALVTLPFSRGRSLHWARAAARNLGQLSSLQPHRYQEYRAPRAAS